MIVIRFFRYLVIVLCIASQANAQQFSYNTATEETFTKGQTTSSGCSWGDFNNDGWQDLLITSWGTDNDALYRNNGDGTFSQLSNSIVSTDAAASSGGVWGDYDNDGFIDLFVPTTDRNLLYRNNGDETFTKITDGSIVNDPVPQPFSGANSAAWGDYNNDGFLDLYVTQAAGKNCLYQNNGDATFTKITQGVIVEESFSRDCAWIDYDNDCDLDLLVTISNSARLFRNDGGNGFRLITELVEYDMITTFSWGDFDNDGFFDLLMGWGNSTGDISLYRNNGDGTFGKRIDSGLSTKGNGARGSGWGDFNNDGFLDIFFTNIQGNNGTNLYSNNGNGTFTEVTSENFIVSGPEPTSWCDYNNDGYLDLLILTHHGGSNQLYNNNGGTNNWLEVEVRSDNGLIIGTKINVSYRSQSRMISSSSGHLSQTSSVAHFGLGNSTEVDVTITWPSGLVQQLENVAANKKIIVDEDGTSLYKDIDLGPDLLICDETSVLLQAPEGFDSYHWNNNSNSAALTVNQSGVYFVDGRLGCRSTRDSINVKFEVTPHLELGTDVSLCDKQSFQLNPGAEGVTYLWSTGATDTQLMITESGAYWLRIENECGNAADTIDVEFVKALDELELGEDTVLCAGQPLQLKVSDEYDAVAWNTGATTHVLDLTTSGFYRVTAWVKNCSNRDSINVKFESPPALELGADISTCDEQPVLLSPEAEGVTYLWSTGSTNPHLTITEPGTYWLRIDNKCGSDTDTIQAEFVKPLEKLELGDDMVLCVGQTVRLEVSNEYHDVAWSTGATTHVLDVTTSGLYRVNAKLKNCSYTDSARITFDQKPASIFSSGEMLVCELSELKLAAGPEFDTYLWQNGSTDSTITIISPGSYRVTVTNACGSFDDTIDVNLFSTGSAFIPNVMTPNGDTQNDSFIVDEIITGSKLEVFNRWGQPVFHSANYQNDWDGRGLDNGVYYFLITENYCKTKLTGWIHVIR